MNQYKRPEKEDDPNKLPGQIVNPVPATEYKPSHGGYPQRGRYLRDIIKRIKDEEKFDKPL